jgi:hypothetical protein
MGRGRRVLVLIHLGWIIAVLVDAMLLVFSVPALVAVVHRPCSGPANACLPAQLTLADFRALGGSGPALNAYVIYVLVTVIAASLVWAAVGVVIAWRKWNDPMALFVSLVLITFVPVNITFGATPTITFGATSQIHVPDILALLGPEISILGIAATELIYPALGIFLLTFPTGRFAPRWSAVLVLLWIVQNLLFFVQAPFAAIQLWLLTTFGSAAAIQVYRYAQLYTPVQRQQTKWIIVTFAFVSLPLYAGYALAPLFWPSLNTPGSMYRLASIAVIMLSLMFIALGIGVAILRHQLYDIDVIIRSTLIYGTLTALLAIIYLAGVIGLQALVQALTGVKPLPPVVVVASTLLIAALFNPLRRRLQLLIDHRFYRYKYDAERTLASFGAALTTETSIEHLSARLLAVVEETMRPEHVSLWLRSVHSRRVGTGDGAEGDFV